MSEEVKVKASSFEELYNRDIKKYVDKLRKDYTDRQGNKRFFELSYLSWAYGHREMKRIDPDAEETVIEFPLVVNGQAVEGVFVPYLQTPQGFFVKTEVTINGRTESEWLPVLDQSNRPITNPNSFQINTSHKRCFVKALAKHGLGLYLYVGEDLPEDITTPEKLSEHTPEHSNGGTTITEPTLSEAMAKAKELKKSIATIKKITQKQVDEWLFDYLKVTSVAEIKDWNKAVLYLIKLEDKAKEQANG